MVEYDRNVEYCTNDLYFAAYLLTVGCKKTRCILEKTGVFYFLFDNQKQTIQTLEKDYFTHNARIDPLSYKHSLKDLRTEMNFIRK